MEFNEGWNDPAFNNDVALITVSEPFNFTDPNVQPIEMFKGSDAEIPQEPDSSFPMLFNGLSFLSTLVNSAKKSSPGISLTA